METPLNEILFKKHCKEKNYECTNCCLELYCTLVVYPEIPVNITEKRLQKIVKENAILKQIC